MKWKGHRDFIRAAAQVHKAYPEARFVIVGGIVREDQVFYKGFMEITMEGCFDLTHDVFFCP